MGLEQAPTFAQLLKGYRLAAGLTQDELAARANLSVRAISDLERGVKTRPYLNTVQVLSDALGLAGDERPKFVAVARRPSGPVRNRSMGDAAPDGARGAEQASSCAGFLPDAAAQDSPRAPCEPGQIVSLPWEPTSFVGREREVMGIAAMLRREEVRLLSLCGPGGIGKTRLAVQAAGDVTAAFPHGVFFVPLAAVGDPSLVISAIAAALGLKDDGGQPAEETVRAHLRGRRVLLVVDNFEHVTQAAPVLGELLAGSRGLRMLVTSREVLRLRGEQEFPVPPLAVPDPERLPDLDCLTRYDAVKLFVERARAVKPDFEVTGETARAVAEICRRLDGLPLAIELAAARIRLFPPPALLFRLSSRLAFLTGGARNSPRRQRTLRDTLEWSFGLLTEEEKALFARLSVFVGGCDFAAVEAVCNPHGELDVLEGMTSLVRKSLVRQQDPHTGCPDEPRFLMLETIHEYATEKLAGREEDGQRRALHAAYFLELAEKAEPELRGNRQREWLERLDVDHENLRAALDWLLEGRQAEPALRLCIALCRFWWLRGYLSDDRPDGARRLDRALAMSGEVTQRVPVRTRTRALFAAGWLAFHRGDLERAAALSDESLTLARLLDDRSAAADALNTLAGIEMARGGRVERAARFLEESLELRRAIGDQGAIATALYNLGNVAYRCGDVGRAVALYAESRDLAREAGHSWLIGLALSSMALALSRQGELDRATCLYEESLAVLRGLGERFDSLESLEGLAWIASEQRRGERAARLYGAAEALRTRYSVPLAGAYQEDHERDLARARAKVDPAVWQTAWSAGQSMPWEQAVEYALRCEL